MADGQPTAIEIQGITRNRTKIGVEDGMAEDLINLRFINGAWRTSGNGRQVYSMTQNASGYTYTHVFVHTNVYRHVLGIRQGFLWWFANIGTDGVTFEAISPSAERLCEASDDVIITQTGHMLTVISGDTRTALLFNRAKDSYTTEEKQDASSEEGNRSTPYGEVKFRVMNNRKSCSYKNSLNADKTADCIEILTTTCGEQTISKSGSDVVEGGDVTLIQAGFVKIIAALKKQNSFHGPFLACLALKMYDGRYVLASSPTLVNPSYFGDGHYGKTPSDYKIDYLRLSDYISNPTIVTSDRRLYKKYGFGFGTAALKQQEDVSGFTNVKKSYYAGDSSIMAPASRKVGDRDFARDASVLDQDAMLLYGQKDSDDNWGYGLASIAHAPTIGSFTMYQADDSQIGPSSLPAATQDNIVYGKINHLEFYIDELDASESLYQSLCVFVTPVFDVYDMSNGFDHSYAVFSNGIVSCFDNDGGYVYPSITPVNPGTAYGGQQYTGGGFVNRHWGVQYIPKTVKFRSGEYGNLLNQISNAQFQCIKEIPIAQAKTKTKQWVEVELDEFIIESLYSYSLPRLEMESFQAGLRAYNAKCAYTYNGRLHLANYLRKSGFDWGIESFKERDFSEFGRIYVWDTDESKYTLYRSVPGVSWQGFNTISKAISSTLRNTIYEKFSTMYSGVMFMATLKNGVRVKVEDALKLEPTLPAAVYYDLAVEFVPADIAFTTNDSMDELKAFLNIFSSANELEATKRVAIYYSSSNQTSTSVDMSAYDIKAMICPTFTSESNAIKLDNEYEFDDSADMPNGLMCSAVDNPLVFPVENYYQIGSGAILGMASNTIAVGTGQTGAAPLYVFCTDGIYALFVDETGKMVYSNARILFRDIVNNPHSITPIDQGVVFSTDRGLMMIAGEQVQEIGEPAEGDVLKFADSTHADSIPFAKTRMEYVAGLPPATLCDGVDFLTYLKDGDGAIINYNHNERELMVSNPTKVTTNGVTSHKYPYSYVMDKEFNWSRRDYTADEYVNNYPTSYRLVNGEFYKVDEEGSDNTQLEQRKEADNKFFYLSNIIKLQSIGFKEAHRFVVRGYFESDIFAEGMNEESKVFVKCGYFEDKIGETVRLFYSGGRWQTAVPVRTDIAEEYWTYTAGASLSDVHAYDENGAEITDSLKSDYYNTEHFLRLSIKQGYVGCYVLGSYDGRKWAVLGGNEKQGRFTDIGCLVERTDVKFLRVCLAGQVTGKTRIDYMEISSEPSRLNTKIR